MQVIPTYNVTVKALDQTFRVSDRDIEVFLRVLIFNNLKDFTVSDDDTLANLSKEPQLLDHPFVQDLTGA